MSAFENYAREARDLEHAIATKGIILGIDWDDPGQVRELAGQALDCHIGDLDCEPDEPRDRARLELFGLIQLMLKVMKESADDQIHTHGGQLWKTLARALWAEHDLRNLK